MNLNYGEHGWLKNKDRLQRRENASTLTDNQVQKLIDTIDALPHYTKLDPEIDAVIRSRDKALIATNWTWFKRGNEILHLRLGDMTVTNEQVMISLLIEKKNKTYKICPSCAEKKNSKEAKFCKVCGADITNTLETETGKKTHRRVKTKSSQFSFCKPILEWQRQLEKLKLEPTAWMFPRYHYFSKGFLFYAPAPLTIQRYDQILQRLDPTMTSALFRYGGAEKYLRLGYTPFELKEIGDWESSKMPELYADKKGLTISQKKFADDLR
jgi:uncharacterized protein with PIN domain